MNRRDNIKTFAGTILAGAAGIPFTSQSILLNKNVLTSKDMHLLFNIQKVLEGNNTGLIFNLVCREPHENKYAKIIMPNDSKNDIPTLQFQFEKQVISCNRMIHGNVINSTNQFINYVIDNIIPIKQTKPYDNVDLFIEANQISLRSHRGAANVIMTHPDIKFTHWEQYLDRFNFVYSEHMPKNKIIMWYNGHEFYDGAVTIIHRENNINEYMLCIHDDCIDKYCSLIEI